MTLICQLKKFPSDPQHSGYIIQQPFAVEKWTRICQNLILHVLLQSNQSQTD